MDIAEPPSAKRNLFGESDTFAKFPVRNPLSGGFLGQKALGRHAGQGVGFQAVGAALLIHQEIYSGIKSQPQDLVDLFRLGLQKLSQGNGDLGGADFLRSIPTPQKR